MYSQQQPYGGANKPFMSSMEDHRGHNQQHAQMNNSVSSSMQQQPTMVTNNPRPENFLSYQGFVANNCEDDVLPTEATERYKGYKNQYILNKANWIISQPQIYTSAIIQDRYDLRALNRIKKINIPLANNRASLFFTLMDSGNLTNLSYSSNSGAGLSDAYNTNKTKISTIIREDNHRQDAMKHVVELIDNYPVTDPLVHCLKLKNIPPNLGYNAISTTLKEIECLEGLISIGFETNNASEIRTYWDTLGIGGVSVRDSIPPFLTRDCYLQYSSADSALKAMSKLHQRELGDPVDQKQMLDFETSTIKPALYTAYPEACGSMSEIKLSILDVSWSHPEVIATHLKLSTDLITALDHDNEIQYGDFIKITEGKKNKDINKTNMGEEAANDNNLVAIDDKNLNNDGVVSTINLPQSNPLINRISVRDSTYEEQCAQLDLQIFYLAFVHMFNFYTGKRHRSLREAIIPSQKHHDNIEKKNNIDEDDDITEGAMKQKKASNSLHNSIKTNGILRLAVTEEDLKDINIIERITNARNADPTLDSHIKDIESTIEKIRNDDDLLEIAVYEDRSRERWEKFVEDSVVHHGAERARCAVCEKLFRGPEFVKKHLENRHAAEKEGITQEVYKDAIIQRFNSDPMRTVLVKIPSASSSRYPHSGGHSKFNNRSSGAMRRGRLGMKYDTHNGYSYRDWDTPSVNPNLGGGEFRKPVDYNDL